MRLNRQLMGLSKRLEEISVAVPKKIPRVVIDTNIFVSGLISSAQSPPVKILNAVKDKKIIHIVSDPIVEEYLRVLDYPRIRKFNKITDEFVRDIAAYLIHWTERVEVVSHIKKSQDPDDDIFLETAVDGTAALLITGDKADLLHFGEIQGIPVVSAAEAVQRLKL